jgi:Uma2 family endonuclease
MIETLNPRMTLEEYLSLPETTKICELVEGVLFMPPTPHDSHQRIIGNVLSSLQYLMQSGKLRQILTGLHLDDKNFYQPDVFWVSNQNDHCELGEDGYWYGAPDLIVEVLSPSTTRNDRVTKFQLYEKYGVREYWIADPEMRSFEVWFLETKTLSYQGVYGLGKTFTSKVLNTLVEVNRLLGEG